MSRKDVPDLLIVRHASVIRHNRRVNLVRRLIEATGQPETIVYAALDRALARGLIDYTVTVRWAFPTERGLQLLEEAHG